MRAIVCGGRDYQDKDTVFKVLDEADPRMVIQGGARGADALARLWAEEHEKHVVECPANWKQLSYAAGPIRNKLMLELAPDYVIAFPGGAGTRNMIREATKAGVPVYFVGDFI